MFRHLRDNKNGASNDKVSIQLTINTKSNDPWRDNVFGDTPIFRQTEKAKKLWCITMNDIKDSYELIDFKTKSVRNGNNSSILIEMKGRFNGKDFNNTFDNFDTFQEFLQSHSLINKNSVSLDI